MKYDTKVQKDTASSENAKPEVLNKNKMAAAAILITTKIAATRSNFA